MGDILTTKLFFYDVLQELDRYMKRFKIQKTTCVLLLLINRMALLMAFLGVKRNRTFSDILSNLVVFSFLVDLTNDSSVIYSAAKDVLSFVWMFVAFELVFLCLAFVLYKNIKFFLLSLSLALQATNMLEESACVAEESGCDARKCIDIRSTMHVFVLSSRDRMGYHILYSWFYLFPLYSPSSFSYML